MSEHTTSLYIVEDGGRLVSLASHIRADAGSNRREDCEGRVIGKLPVEMGM